MSGVRQRAVRCLVVDDHATVRAGVRTILLDEPDFEVVGEAATADEAVTAAERGRPDVVVMDLRLAGPADGLAATRRILERRPATGVMLLTGSAEPGLLSDALASGARGYVLKDARPEDVVRAARSVAGGGRYVDPALAARLAAAEATRPEVRLTPREREVLALLADGLRAEEIGSRLNIAPATVRTHVRLATRRLGAGTFTQAVAEALRRRMIE
jgi:DNA-binding NarL/FixJ family response regulator